MPSTSHTKLGPIITNESNLLNHACRYLCSRLEACLRYDVNNNALRGTHQNYLHLHVRISLHIFATSHLQLQINTSAQP